MMEKKVDADHDIITIAWGADKTGVLLGLSKMLAENSLNILYIDLKVFRGWFYLVIISQLMGDSGLDFHKLDDRLKQMAESMGYKIENTTILRRERKELEGNIVIVACGDNQVGLLERILQVTDRCRANIVDMSVSVDEEANKFALKLYTDIPVGEEMFFETMENIRKGLQCIKSEIGIDNFYTMVHREETFRYIQQVDYERVNYDER